MPESIPNYLVPNRMLRRGINHSKLYKFFWNVFNANDIVEAQRILDKQFDDNDILQKFFNYDKSAYYVILARYVYKFQDEIRPSHAYARTLNNFRGPICHSRGHIIQGYDQ